RRDRGNSLRFSGLHCQIASLGEWPHDIRVATTDSHMAQNCQSRNFRNGPYSRVPQHDGSFISRCGPFTLIEMRTCPPGLHVERKSIEVPLSCIINTFIEVAHRPRIFADPHYHGRKISEGAHCMFLKILRQRQTQAFFELDATLLWMRE